jgi:hypothetical protein
MISEGGDQDWSHASDAIVFDRIDKDGVYQLHTARPDGSDERCLSCVQRPGAPPIDRHKFNPTWHASGKYIVLQGEIDSHPLAWTHKNRMVAELLLNGLWNNLYATDSTGERWYKLTTSVSPQTDGVLGPHFSPDGTKLLWSRLVSPASGENPWGLWRLMIGDFVISGDVPSLQNVSDITPAGGKFYEAHGFSADGGTVVFTSDMETTSRWEMNIWVMNLSDKKMTKLTKNGAWNEHAQYSPSGKKIVYMSSEPYPGTSLKTDLMIMNSDGSGKAQLTHFNMPGYPESQPDQNVPGRSSWSADGTRLSVTAGPAKDFPTRRLWILTFAGRCGG